MATVEIDPELLSLDLLATDPKVENIKFAPEDLGKENISKDVKPLLSQKRKFQDSECKVRPLKRAKIEAPLPKIQPKLNPADVPVKFKFPLPSLSLPIDDDTASKLAAGLNFLLSCLTVPLEDTSSDRADDEEILLLPDPPLPMAIEPVPIVDPPTSNVINMPAIEAFLADPFEIQEGIQILRINDRCRLFLGNADVANNKEWLLAANVQYIANLALEVPNFHENDPKHEFVYKKESFQDSEKENILSKLDSLTNFINMGLHRGSVLVHCKVGRSRSVAIIYAFLMKYGGKTLLAAKNLIEDELRVTTKLNDGFKRQLMEFEKLIRGVTVPSHDFFNLPKRVSTPPARLRTLDNFVLTKNRRNSAPPTVPVNSSSPRKAPRKGNKVKAKEKKLLHAAVGVPSVKDLIQKLNGQVPDNNGADSNAVDSSESTSESSE